MTGYHTTRSLHNLRDHVSAYLAEYLGAAETKEDELIPQVVERGGLVYKLDYFDDEPLYRFRPAGGFTVDGVWYDSGGRYCEQSFIQFKGDQGWGVRMRCDAPPTDAELDAWVTKQVGDRDGIPLPRTPGGADGCGGPCCDRASFP